MHGVDVTAHELLAPASVLGDEAGPLQDGHVLLDGGEAHRVVDRQRGDRVVPAQAASHDVAPRRVGEGVEDVVRPARLLNYNHKVVR